MAVAVLDQVDLQEVHLQVVEPIAIYQQPIEVVVDHSPLQVAGTHQQVQMVL
jgi:hypothetical protein